ncbi:hypothetical protein ABBQ32_012770 [Trebouxia sp. C0010 RCD-2024]
MNLRGVLEFVENEAKKFGATNIHRFGLWKWILKQKPDLRSCIQTTTSWDEQKIPGKIQSLYDTLNKHHHVGKTPAEWTAFGGLKIEEGPKISILDCRLLKCICKSYGIQAEVIPKSDQYSDSDIDQYSDSDIDQYSDSDIDQYSDSDIDQYSDSDIDQYSDSDIDQYSDSDIDQYSDSDID